MTLAFRWRLFAAFVALCFPVVAFAQSIDPPPACAGPLDAESTVRCVLARSPEVLAARLELAALSGRRNAAGVLLPSHPELSGTLAHRTGPAADGQSGRNWNITLAQEIPLPGKRAARLAEVDAERAAAVLRVAAAERDVAVAALRALYVAAVADEALGLAADLERGAIALAGAMAARAAEGLVSPVEADLAAAEAVRLSIVRLDLDGRRAGSRAQLAELLGITNADRLLAALAPSVLATGTIPALDLDALIARGLTARAEVAVALAEREAASARIERVRHQRVPNFVLSVFAQRDGFDERVLGGGITVPLFLPAPLGPSGKGEIEEAEARRSQSDLRIEAIRRRVREEIVSRLATWQARRAALDRHPPSLVERAHAHVVALADAVKNRQLAPREAVFAQRAFIELLQGHLEARLAEAVARIELLRVAGLPLPGVTP